MKTILITGSSSGFGLETASYFLERGWKVIATMRSPRADILPKSDNLKIIALDVSKPESIRKAIAEAGPIDVLVNNAGIGVLNALEGMSMEVVHEVFDTNTIGTIAMTQAVIPQMRERKNGVIINVTSSVTLKSLPLLAVYTASKAAVNAFSESVAHELKPFNVRICNVLPGRAPTTKFAENGKARMAAFPEPYQEQVHKVFEAWQHSTEPTTNASDVAEAVWKAVHDTATPMRMPAGADAVLWSQGQ